MDILDQAGFLLRITRTHNIIRRYFVVNGFDGALTMLGMIIGFWLSGPQNLTIIINGCVGAAVALGMSGIFSAYISESAEQKRSLGKLEKAMVSDLQGTAYGDAARWVPLLIAIVNGAAPLVMSVLILLPLWLSQEGVPMPIPPLYVAMIIALLLIFLLGVFLGKIAGVSWLRSGFQTLAAATATVVFIYLLTHH